ncbi:predicted protein [Histoplasma mississippiense (nom. inval.)]|uniref:predicted protein n=1 Tax=Ajellomyces capsulatus (strain NAm1 / WU24) TaxID=2059318 RepID=UPI000157BC42|nr:predicted protein [Histoplasma mississippiense (nom. inval.)]EDN05766.1 predicted protein [Histoplasma mississippiense (nom. inval.)]
MVGRGFGYFGNSVMVLVILLDEFTVPQPVDPSSGYMVTTNWDGLTSEDGFNSKSTWTLEQRDLETQRW